MPLPLDIPARIALLPLLAAQAIAVRRGALNLPEAAGPRMGETGTGDPLSLLVLGDSSAAGVGAASQQEALAGNILRSLTPRHRIRWQVVAKTGATTASMLVALRETRPDPADIAIVALGVNDVTRATSARVFEARQRALHDWLRAELGTRLIIRAGVPPMAQFPALPQPLAWVLGQHAARLDARLAGIAARDPDVVHMPFDLPIEPEKMAPDGYHPGPEVYAIWGARTAEVIRARTRV